MRAHASTPCWGGPACCVRRWLTTRRSRAQVLLALLRTGKLTYIVSQNVDSLHLRR